MISVAVFVLFFLNATSVADFSQSHGSTSLDAAVTSIFHQTKPDIAYFKTLFSARADEQHDVLLILGSTAPVLDSWSKKGDLLGLFLRERTHPDRIHRLALREESGAALHVRSARYVLGELMVEERLEYGAGALNLKFFFDPRSKTLIRQAEYHPFSVPLVVYDHALPYFIAENGDLLLAIRASNEAFQVLRGPQADRLLARIPVIESSTPGGRVRSINERAMQPPKFGPGAKFSILIEENQSWGRVATGIDERVARTTKTYPLPPSSCNEFKRQRPREYTVNRCPIEMREEIGPNQVFEGRLWFAKSFYDAEGSGGVGAFGYFDPLERKYRLISTPEVAGWSGSALLVENDAVWIALMHRGEYGDTPGGLLRWDRTTHSIARYHISSVVKAIVRCNGRLYLSTMEGIDIWQNGAIAKYIVDQTATGGYEVVRISDEPRPGPSRAKQ